MRATIKPIFLVTIMLLSSMSTIIMIPEAEAAQVVITEAIQVSDGGSANDRASAVAADSEGNVHVIWARSNLHIFYTMISPRGITMIDATQITNSGLHSIQHLDMVIDEQDKIHIAWADKRGQHSIMYTALRPYNANHDGSVSDDVTLSAIDDFEVSSRSENRDWPSLDVDSKGNIHIAWQDSYDELNIYYQQPQIYYSMIQPDYESNSAQKLFTETLLTPIIGHKGHPDVAVDSDDIVQIAWDDTRGGKVELVFIIDGSGSMGTEWADVCSVVYGGNFASGGYFQGIKPMLVEANMTVYETLYVLYDGYSYPSEISNGACQSRNNIGNSWRNYFLDAGDDSGGIRQLPATVFNGGSYSGTSGEDWGPGTNWACLSWMDSGNYVPGNPPTANDHYWNPNATKIVIPISDEGPKDGSPEQQADDIQSINEAHDSCVNAGVIPVGLYGQGWGGANSVQSHMEDLVQCPNGVVSTAPRNCPGGTVRTTNAGGQAYEFPSGTNNQMQILVEAMVYISTNNSREIYITSLDPYGKMQNDPNWIPGEPGHSSAGGYYTEDTGYGEEGHLVVVNDTRVTNDDAFSFHPSIAIDGQGYTHVAWMDGRDYGFEKTVPYEIYYTKLKLKGAGESDGGSLSTYSIKKIYDTPISTVEGKNGVPNGASPSSLYPALLTDYQNNVHIAWLDMSNKSAFDEVQYVRLNNTQEQGVGMNFTTGQGALDPWEISAITTWESDKLGSHSSSRPTIGQPPAFANDLGSGAHVAWSDTKKCGDIANNNRYTICYSHVLTGQVDIDYEVAFDYRHTIEPGEETIYNLTMNNSTPGPTELVSDTYNLNFSMEGTILDVESGQKVPLSVQNWTAALYFASNHTQIRTDTDIFLEGGETIRFYLRVKAPSVYQAGDNDVDCTVIISSVSTTDPAIRADKPTITTMDVVHGIDIETSHRMADVEQGGTAIFSITITNTGNVYDSFSFYIGAQPSSQTSGAFTDWQLPFAWQAVFPNNVDLTPKQSITKNLELSIPSGEDPGTFVIYLEGLSDGEPIRIIEKGTYDVLELWINVSVKTKDNIVFTIFDTSAQINPGDCYDYTINVEKREEPGDLVFATPGAPVAAPEGMDLVTWRKEQWTTELIFGNNDYPPLNDPSDMNSGRPWPADSPIAITAKICAPTNASAGLGPAFTVKAHLKGYPKVSDSRILSTSVNHIYNLDATTPEDTLTVDPSEQWVLPVMVANLGNGPDRFDMRLASVRDSSNVEVQWDIDVPRESFEELKRDTMQEFEVTLNVPDQVQAGVYTITLHAFSEEAYAGPSGHLTRLRDVLTFTITVNEFYDMRISIDETQDNAVKISAPGRIVKFVVNLTNAGNVADTPSLHNHTTQKDSSSGVEVWSKIPGMGSLSDWMVTWSMVEFLGSDLTKEIECEVSVSTASAYPEDSCVYLSDINEWRLPEMEAYSTHMMYATVHISTAAKLDTRQIGLKVTSMAGNAEAGGDHDDTPSWAGEDLDSNELVLTLRLRAPNLVISEVSVSSGSADVGEAIPIRIVLQNNGNVHATDVEIVLCEFSSIDEDTMEDIRQNGCPEESIVMRQIIGAILAPDATLDAKEIEIYMLYPITAGSHEVVVVVDPQNTIVEVSERDNIQLVGDELSSSSPFLDVAGSIVATYSLPTGILLLTLALFAVLYLVGSGRRADVKNRLAEQSSLMNVLGDEEESSL